MDIVQLAMTAKASGLSSDDQYSIYVRIAERSGQRMTFLVCRVATVLLANAKASTSVGRDANIMIG